MEVHCLSISLTEEFTETKEFILKLGTKHLRYEVNFKGNNPLGN